MPFRKSKGWGNTKPPVGYGVDWGDQINKGLLWRCLTNEGAGARVKDLVRNVDGSFANSPSWTAFQKGGAIKFDGSSNYVDFGADTIAPSGPLTLSAWMLETVAVGSNNSPIGCYGSQYGYGFQVNNSQVQSITGGFSGWCLGNLKSFAINTWVMVTMTLDASLSQKLFINGLLVDTVQAAGSQAYNAKSFYIGANKQYATYWNGSVGNAAVWKRALAQSEISRLYTEPFAGIIAPRRRIISGVAAAPTGFKPYWARPSAQIVGG